jgi:predicted PurR-regulated permease PerM
VLSQEKLADERGYIRAREVFIRMSLLAMMAITCYVILRPFLLLLLWSIVLATATFPGYRWIARAMGGRERLAAALCTALLLALIILPSVLLAGTLVGAAQSLAAGLQSGNLSIPPPPAKIATWPVVGTRLTEVWSLASSNITEAINKFSPYLREYIPKLLTASAALGGTLLQFIISILIAGYLLATYRASATLSHSIFDRIFSDRGEEFEELTKNTIRSVTNGILGVAVIQSVLAGIGFLAVGLPGAGMWAAMFLVASVVQIGPLVLIPSIIYAFTVTSTTPAVIFLVWSIFVGATDNVLKPLMLGRGSMVPTAVIFLGVIGGFVAMGIVGLFVGAIILSVGYKLFLVWLAEVRPRTLAAVKL